MSEIYDYFNESDRVVVLTTDDLLEGAWLLDHDGIITDWDLEGTLEGWGARTVYFRVYEPSTNCSLSGRVTSSTTVHFDD